MIYVILEADIKEGKISDFRKLISQMGSFNKDFQPDTLDYKIFTSQDERLFTFFGDLQR